MVEFTLKESFVINFISFSKKYNSFTIKTIF